MPRIDVADGAKFLVIATGKCRTAPNPSGSLDNAAIQPNAEFDHGVGLVDVMLAKKLGTGCSERGLCRGKNLASVLTTARKVHQAKQHSPGVDPEKIIIIPGHSLAIEDGGNISSI